MENLKFTYYDKINRINKQLKRIVEQKKLLETKIKQIEDEDIDIDDSLDNEIQSTLQYLLNHTKQIYRKLEILKCETFN